LIGSCLVRYYPRSPFFTYNNFTPARLCLSSANDYHQHNQHGKYQDTQFTSPPLVCIILVAFLLGKYALARSRASTSCSNPAQRRAVLTTRIESRSDPNRSVATIDVVFSASGKLMCFSYGHVSPTCTS